MRARCGTSTVAAGTAHLCDLAAKFVEGRALGNNRRLSGVTKARNRAFLLDAIPLYLQRSRPGTVAGARASGVPACLPLSHSDNVARAIGLGRTGRDEATVRGQRLARNKDNSSAHRGRSARVVIALSVTGRARRKP